MVDMKARFSIGGRTPSLSNNHTMSRSMVDMEELPLVRREELDSLQMESMASPGPGHYTNIYQHSSFNTAHKGQ